MKWGGPKPGEGSRRMEGWNRPRVRRTPPDPACGTKSRLYSKNKRREGSNNRLPREVFQAYTPVTHRQGRAEQGPEEQQERRPRAHPDIQKNKEQRTGPTEAAGTTPGVGRGTDMSSGDEKAHGGKPSGRLPGGASSRQVRSAKRVRLNKKDAGHPQRGKAYQAKGQLLDKQKGPLNGVVERGTVTQEDRRGGHHPKVLRNSKPQVLTTTSK